jgi:hypothetical protein
LGVWTWYLWECRCGASSSNNWTMWPQSADIASSIKNRCSPTTSGLDL